MIENDWFLEIKQNQNSGPSKVKPVLSVKGLIAEAASAHQRIIVVLLGWNPPAADCLYWAKLVMEVWREFQEELSIPVDLWFAPLRISIPSTK